MVQAVLNIIALSVAITVVANAIPGIKVKDFTTSIKVAVVYSLIHFLLFKIIVFFTLPFVVLTLGLAVVIINALLLWVTDIILDDFEIDGPITTLIASVAISLLNLFIQFVLKLIF